MSDLSSGDVIVADALEAYLIRHRLDRHRSE